MVDEIKNPEEVVKPFFADNYPVTDKMFGKPTANRPVTTSHLLSENTAWFTNDSLQQTLMFILFSDHSRLVLYYKEFFSSTKKIDTKYFISNMGFKIGDPKEKAITTELVPILRQD